VSYQVSRDSGEVADVPVIAGNVRWERPTVRSFWNALADPERQALAAAGAEEIFRPGSVLCRAGDDSSQVMIIDAGWVKVSVRGGSDAAEKILAVRGQGDVVGERAALMTQVRSATVTALDEVSAMVLPAERFAEFLSSHPHAVEVLHGQVAERREEDRARRFPGEPAGTERRLAWLLFDLAQRRGGYQHSSAAVFTLPMSQHELADWVGTSADAIGRFLRSWRDRGIVARTGQSRRLTVVDLDALAVICDAGPAAPRGAGPAAPGDAGPAAPGDAGPAAPGDAGPAAPGDAGPAVPRDLASGAGTAAGADPGPMAGRAATRWFGGPSEPLNCSVLFTDVAGFGNPNRTDADRGAVRAALYAILQESLEASGVPWAECYHEDRGDGVIVVVPPVISTRRVIDPLIPVLAARLRQYNRRASDVVLIQLRAALHAGPVGKDAEGLTGRAIISTARILDARVIKDRLAAEQADLIFAVSDYVYEHVVTSLDGQVDVTAFTHVEDQVKESRVSAWIHLAGRIEAPSSMLTGPGLGPRPVAPPLGKLPAEVRGRDGLLGEFRRALRPYPRRASRAFVIAGMGGLGKSTVALAAVRMAKDRGLPRLVGERGRRRVADRRDAGGAAGTRRA
jgi:CRP-like cAMP-binding protein